MTAVHVTDDTSAAHEFRKIWEVAVPDVPLLAVESPYREFVAPLVAFFHQLQQKRPSARVTLILPALAARHWWERLLHNRTSNA